MSGAKLMCQVPRADSHESLVYIIGVEHSPSPTRLTCWTFAINLIESNPVNSSAFRGFSETQNRRGHRSKQFQKQTLIKMPKSASFSLVMSCKIRHEKLNTDFS